eukprot:Platyproteum_vivax@DN1243_c0_g1_i1.p1
MAYHSTSSSCHILAQIAYYIAPMSRPNTLHIAQPQMQITGEPQNVHQRDFTCKKIDDLSFYLTVEKGTKANTGFMLQVGMKVDYSRFSKRVQPGSIYTCLTKTCFEPFSYYMSSEHQDFGSIHNDVTILGRGLLPALAPLVFLLLVCTSENVHML